MKEIGTINLHRMNNGAHFLYVSNVLARAEADTKVSEKAAAQVSALKTAVAQEDRDLKLSQKSLLTDDIAQADHDRDQLYIGYKQAVKGFLNLPVENLAQAAKALNQHIIDYAIDPQEQLDKETGMLVNFLADLEELTMESSAPAAKVVINSRTGSIVLNQSVTLGPCAIAHGNLSFSISTTPSVSQPNPLSQGQTVVTEKSNIQIKQEPGILIQVPPAPQLADVVRALNALGATPQDLLAILQAIKAAGALNAELEVI